MSAPFDTSRHMPVLAAVLALLMVLASALFALEPWRGGPVGPHVAVKAGLGEYSWQELSGIAAQIAACSSEDAAVGVAARYGLCAQDGRLDSTHEKEVVLADGSTIAVQVVGIWHDERADGGRAGLSFMFSRSAGEHAMNHAFDADDAADADSMGGWAASDMRAWLNGDFLYTLPADLRAVIVPVVKRTASAARSSAETAEPGHISGSGDEWCVQTEDALWLPSAVELCGEVPANEDQDIDESMTRTYAGEGAQYRLFADTGAHAFTACPALVRSGADGSLHGTWWLRTKTLEFGEGFWLVGTDGAPLAGLGEDASGEGDVWGPDHPRAVVAGFCL